MNRSTEKWTISGPSRGKGPTDDGGDYAILNSQGEIIAETYRQTVQSSFQDALANARLIAASPQQHGLFMKIEAVLAEWMGTHDDNELLHLVSISLPEMLKDIRAAIAAAQEGEKP